MTFGLSEELINSARAAFNSFDKDSDGLIAFDDLERCLRTLKLNPTAEEASAMVEDAQEVSKASGVSFTSFLYIFAHARRNNDAVKELINAFRIIGKKGSPEGRIPVETVRRVLRETRQAYTEKQIEDIIDHSNVKNGFVDIQSLANVIISE
ncbi:Calmodulin-like protein 4 [Tritrichomonas musculus]|uniref:Calmodulin-like protein 4 n=1 Tax=Tritrichomonas musculus TaxID=1915356 RepID=A0ABR2KJ25_9EUKA